MALKRQNLVTAMSSWMENLRVFASLSFALALAACRGTEGDVLRTRPDMSGHDDAGATRPRPNPLSTWQIQLSGALATSLDVELYTVDFDTPSAKIEALHAAGRLVICYFSAGTRESFRSDAGEFPAETVGSPLADYPNERWLDVRSDSVRAIMRARVAKAADAGCDGIHPSGLAAFLEDTGFDLGRADQLEYNRSLRTEAHARGLSIGLVEGDLSLSEAQVGDFDWVVVWNCVDSGCAPAVPFISAGKAAFVIEYGDAARAAEVCPRAAALKLSAVVKRDADLDAFRAGCP